MKGLARLTDEQAIDIVTRRVGLKCRWWMIDEPLPFDEVPPRLSDDNLDRHVNHFDTTDPSTNLAFCEKSPFISLSAGCVERATIIATNIAHRARRVALEFATDCGQLDVGHLFYCWVVVPTRPAVGVEMVAEEVRDLNAYRRYSQFQTEGEVAAKIRVPPTQIEKVERWEIDGLGPARKWVSTCLYVNGEFLAPETLSNLRGLV